MLMMVPIIRYMKHHTRAFILPLPTVPSGASYCKSLSAVPIVADLVALPQQAGNYSIHYRAQLQIIIEMHPIIYYVHYGTALSLVLRE